MQPCDMVLDRVAEGGARGETMLRAPGRVLSCGSAWHHKMQIA
jgi:hypothetical protein